MQEQDILQYASGIPVYCAFDKILKIDSVQPNPKNPNQHPFRCERMLDMQEQDILQYASGIPVYCAFDKILKIDSVQPNPKNPNQHSEEQIALLAKIIGTQGWRAPITISTRSGLVVRGHGRLQAALEAGYTEVPVDYQAYTDEESELADLVADNRIAELAQMDAQMLSDIFQNLSDFDLELTGFTEDALKDILVIPEEKIDLEAALAQMDAQMLSDIFQNLSDFDLELTGFTEDALKDILVIPEEKIDLEAADRKVPKPEVRPFTQVGDIWEIGKHRLICGDSTKAHTYKKLMQGEAAQLVITDPPYNVDYEGSAGKIQNDCMSGSEFKDFLSDTYKKLMQGEAAQLVITDPPYNVDYEGSAGKIQNDCMSGSEFKDFLSAMFRCVAQVTRPGAAAYIFYADRETHAFRQGFEDAGFLFKQCLIWVKNTFVLGRQDYQWRHEPILYGWKAGAPHYFTEARNLSTVFDTQERPDFSAMSQEELLEYVESFYDRVDESPASILYCDKPTHNTDHPTMKPTALIAKLVENSSERDWIILDPFSGSGSTLVACEAEGRAARLIEIEPKFCDVIVKRYVQLTGKQDVFCLRRGMKIPVHETKLAKRGDVNG